MDYAPQLDLIDGVGGAEACSSSAAEDQFNCAGRRDGPQFQAYQGTKFITTCRRGFVIEALQMLLRRLLSKQLGWLDCTSLGRSRILAFVWMCPMPTRLSYDRRHLGI